MKYRTKCCNAPLKPDPSSTQQWLIPRCSKCGSTKPSEIYSADADIFAIAKELAGKEVILLDEDEDE